MERQNELDETPLNQAYLNPMIFHQRFIHITEHIFKKMDDKSLKNCREVAKVFQNFIDNQNFFVEYNRTEEWGY